MLTAILIDDLPRALQVLEKDIETYCPDIKILGTADGVVSGAKLLQQHQPDIVFLDIQLKDGTGFDLLDIISAPKFKVIFTTASDAFAVKAFRFAAIDYLLKPIDPDELKDAVEKAKEKIASYEEQLQLVQESIQQNSIAKRIALHTLERIHIVEVSDIIRCESSGNYTIFYFESGEKLLVTKTLKEFDRLLTEFGFFRVHQSHLVNINYITAFVKTEGGFLLMKDDSRVAVSTRKRGSLLELLDSL